MKANKHYITITSSTGSVSIIPIRHIAFVKMTKGVGRAYSIYIYTTVPGLEVFVDETTLKNAQALLKEITNAISSYQEG